MAQPSRANRRQSETHATVFSVRMNDTDYVPTKPCFAVLSDNHNFADTLGFSTRSPSMLPDSACQSCALGGFRFE